jgi:hypothetical protein
MVPYEHVNDNNKLAFIVFFWTKIYKKNIVNLLWVGENAHLHNPLQEHLQ